MNKHAIGMVMVWLAMAVPAQAQSVLRFPASQVQEVSRQLAGSDRNWPVVASVATYLPEENWYELSPTAQGELRRFRVSWNAVQAQRDDFNQQIKQGARVFAAAEMQAYSGKRVSVLQGGNAEWIKAGHPLEKGETHLASPARDRYKRPYEGTNIGPEAMQAYLDWEFGLVAQLGKDGTHHFWVL
jgi:hypothetical protein